MESPDKYTAQTCDSVPCTDTFFHLLWEGGMLSGYKLSAWYSSLQNLWILEGTGGSINGKRLLRLVCNWTGLPAMEGLDAQGRRQHGETSSWETVNGTYRLKTPGVTVWGQHLAMLWRTTRTKGHGYSAHERWSCNWSLRLKGPKVWKRGKPDMSPGNGLGSLSSICTRGSANQAVHSSHRFSGNLSSNSWITE